MCGYVFDVDEPLDAEIDEKVAQKTGFNVLYHRLEFRGLCMECQSNDGPVLTVGEEQGVLYVIIIRVPKSRDEFLNLSEFKADRISGLPVWWDMGMKA